jgi:hypothetical protein
MVFYHRNADRHGSYVASSIYILKTLKDRADPDKVGLYQLFKKPGFVDIRYRVKRRRLVRE